MKPPVIRRPRDLSPARRRERGVTMVLVAVAMIAIISMAALSVDLVTLYLAREEAQRAADAAALTAARIISLSGMTGDPNNRTGSWQRICGPDDGNNGIATRAAKAMARQSAVGSVSAGTVTVTYSTPGRQSDDCSALSPPSAFSVNPMVTVQVQRTGMPTFFSRIWGRTGNSVSATATAEAFNPSNTGNYGAVTGIITPVEPRCVKPWIVPNQDPLNPPPSPNYCTNVGGCHRFVDINTGSIVNDGTSTGGLSTSGVIGERFWLEPDCQHTGSTCLTGNRNPQPIANFYPNNSIRPFLEPQPNLEYLPGVAPAASVAVPTLGAGDPYQEAIAGCDQATRYQCGVPSVGNPSANQVDMTENPSMGTNDTLNGVKALIHEGDETILSPSGQDTLDVSAYPFKLLAGSSNPLLSGGGPMTNSSSVVSLPIYDSDNDLINQTGTTPVTIVGFLQVFIHRVDEYGNVDVTVLNVAGCSNGNGPDSVSGSPITGSSPVPVRLITPP